MKACPMCKQEKTNEEFGNRKPNKAGKVYLHSYCKQCHVTKWKLFKKTDEFKAHQREYARRYYAEQRRLAKLAKEAINNGTLKDMT